MASSRGPDGGYNQPAMDMRSSTPPPAPHTGWGYLKGEGCVRPHAIETAASYDYGRPVHVTAALAPQQHQHQQQQQQQHPLQSSMSGFTPTARNASMQAASYPYMPSPSHKAPFPAPHPDVSSPAYYAPQAHGQPAPLRPTPVTSFAPQYANYSSPVYQSPTTPHGPYAGGVGQGYANAFNCPRPHPVCPSDPPPMPYGGTQGPFVGSPYHGQYRQGQYDEPPRDPYPVPNYAAAAGPGATAVKSHGEGSCRIRGAPLTVAELKKVTELFFKKNVSMSDISKRTGIQYRTVQSVIRRYKDAATTLPSGVAPEVTLQKRGRPRKFSEEDEMRISAIARSAKNKPVREIAALVREELGTDRQFSMSTLQSIIRRAKTEESIPEDPRDGAQTPPPDASPI